MRRSVSATRGSSSSANTSMMNKLVTKSRPVQTSLTRDPASDCPDLENPGHVNFQVQDWKEFFNFIIFKLCYFLVICI